MGTKRRTDWELIERDYRLGIKSIRQLAAEYGINPSSITKRSKAEGWKRDLSQQIKLETRRLVAEGAQKGAQDAHTAIKEAATKNLGVVARHQATIQLLWGEAAGLIEEMGKLRRLTARDEVLVEVLRSLVDDEKLSAQEAKDMVASLSVGARSGVALRLADVLNKLIPLERKSHNIDDSSDGRDLFEKWITSRREQADE